METTNGLTRPVERLEAVVEADQSLPCARCGLGHVFEVLSLNRISERFQGSQEPLPATCARACCAPILDDLRARLAHVGGAA
jgi:hypothetical protein